MCIVLRICLAIVMWRFLSYDVTALPDLSAGPALAALQPAWAESLFSWLTSVLCGDPTRCLLTQTVTLVLATIPLFWMRRGCLILAVAQLLVFQTILYRYRYTIAEEELALMLLLVGCFSPPTFSHEAAASSPKALVNRRCLRRVHRGPVRYCRASEVLHRAASLAVVHSDSMVRVGHAAVARC